MAEKEEASPKEHFKDWDKVEISKDQILEYANQYPEPENRFRVIYEVPGTGIESLYFWSLTHLRQLGYPIIDKITDLFSASESSSLFGAGQQRLGLTQDRVMQFLRLIHDMVRSIPVYVRELRAIAERVSIYEKTEEDDKEGEAAEKTLKGLYVDLVEGGAKSPASVFGLSQQVGFVVLPNLFFETRQGPDESDKDFKERVADMTDDFPQDVVTVLQRKLFQYYNWKKHSEQELKRRRSYLLRYMRQYYSTIKLYMHWVKPYLRAIKRLGLDLEKNTQTELIRAFETSLVEIEVLAQKVEKDTKDKGEKGKGPFNCILMTFNYRTKPSMTHTTPDFQHRGPSHVGEAEITWRSYSWYAKDIEMYKKLKAEEDIDLLKNIDETLRAALEGVEDDLATFLKEADAEVFGEEAKEETKKPKRPPLESFMSPITSIFKGAGESVKAMTGGFKDILKAFWPAAKKDGGGKSDKAVQTAAKKSCFLHYKNFKKAHNMTTW